MYFDEKFVKSLANDPLKAIIETCDRYSEIYNEIDEDDTQEDHALIVETFTFLSKLGEVIGIEINLPESINSSEESLEVSLLAANDSIMKVKADAIRQSTQRQFESYENIFITKYGKVFHYEFSKGDLSTIQNLIDKLRELISTTDELSEDHRHRLIEKLEKVQSEFHMQVSNLDRFWGFCIDLSIVVGLMGKNAKPAADLVKKIVDIIWPAQTRAYEVSSSLPFKLLGQSDDKSKDDKS